MKRYEKYFKESQITVGKKIFNYNLKDIIKRAKELYKKRIKNKMTKASPENEFPYNVETIVNDMIKEQFNLKNSRSVPYNIAAPIIRQIADELNIDILGY